MYLYIAPSEKIPYDIIERFRTLLTHFEVTESSQIKFYPYFQSSENKMTKTI